VVLADSTADGCHIAAVIVTNDGMLLTPFIEAFKEASSELSRLSAERVDEGDTL